MITEEKFVLLKLWAAYTSENVCPPEMACMLSATGGAIVGALPENHGLLSAPLNEAFATLSDMSIKRLVELRDSLT